MRSRLARIALLQAAGVAGCQPLHDGLQAQPVVSPDAGVAIDAAVPDAAAERRPMPQDTAVFCGDGAASAQLQHLFAPDASLEVSPAIGCSDGSREGFLDTESWPKIAGCAGAWDRLGLLSAEARTWSCGGEAGDTGKRPTGVGCSMADLCAHGWHVCTNGSDVELNSTTGSCEGILPPGEVAFFIVSTGASPQGVCYPDQAGSNDLHGCGSIGAAESGTCGPLTRRMGFADCAATCNAWHCGTDDQSLREAEVVTKSSPLYGGVLCCKD